MALGGKRGKMERGESSRSREEEDPSTPPPALRSESGPPGSGATKTQLRAIRSGYQQLKTVISGEKEKLVRDSETFDKLIGHFDNLFGKVERPREQRADLEAICGLSSSLLEYAKKFQENTGPTPTDLVTALLDRYQVNSEEAVIHMNWAALGADSMSIIRDAPGIFTMIGPMSMQAKTRKKYTGRRREKPGPCARAEEVVEAENQSSETDKNIEALFRILRTHKRVRFEALVLNRRCFAQTVENIFALSFLVKDGRVEISCEDDGTHYVVPKNAPTADDRGSGKVVNTQFVLRLDYEDWLFMKETLEQGQELMPDRDAPVPDRQQTPPAASLTPIRKTSRNRARETAGSQAQEEETKLRPQKILRLG